MTAPTIGNLAAALAKVQAQMPTVGKGKTANTGSFSYKYADLADVQAAVLPLLAENDLAFIVTPQAASGGFEVAAMLVHSSGEFIDAALPLFGRTSQEIGSALTYARRYLLGCLTGVVTDDDDDGQAGNGGHRTEKPLQPKTKGRLFALFAQKGIAEEDQLAGINRTLGTAYTSRNDLSDRDGLAVIASLEKLPDAPAPAVDETTGGEVPA